MSYFVRAINACANSRGGTKCFLLGNILLFFFLCELNVSCFFSIFVSSFVPPIPVDETVYISKRIKSKSTGYSIYGARSVWMRDMRTT